MLPEHKIIKSQFAPLSEIKLNFRYRNTFNSTFTNQLQSIQASKHLLSTKKKPFLFHMKYKYSIPKSYFLESVQQGFSNSSPNNLAALSPFPKILDGGH